MGTHRLVVLSALLLLVSGACSGNGPIGQNNDGPPADVPASEPAGEQPAGDRQDAAAGEDHATVDTAADQRADEPRADTGGGGADGPPLGACLGLCLEMFTSACPKTLGCVSSKSGDQTDICYSNGVKERRVVTATDFTGTVKKANGETCYTWRRTGTTQEYIGLDGKVAARYQSGVTPKLFTITCGPADEKLEGDFDRPECSITFAIANQTCDMGACAF